MAQRPDREERLSKLRNGLILSDLGELYDDVNGILIPADKDSTCGMHISTLVLTVFDQPKPSHKHVTCHRDDNRHHNWIENLYWGTRADNLRDAIVNLRIKKPPLEEHIESIIAEYENGDSTCVIAQRYGVTPRAVRWRLLSAGIQMRPKGFQIGHPALGHAIPKVIVYK